VEHEADDEVADPEPAPGALAPVGGPPLAPHAQRLNDEQRADDAQDDEQRPVLNSRRNPCGSKFASSYSPTAPKLPWSLRSSWSSSPPRRSSTAPVSPPVD
jgi:hypothetical protein